MKSEWEYRRELVFVCRMLYDRGHVTAMDGNVSTRLPDGSILLTPSGCCKGFVGEDELIRIDLDGKKLSGYGKPSSEIRMHTLAYRLRADVGAVAHAHPKTCVAFSLAGVPLDDCLMPEVILSIGSIPIASYATPTTEDLPKSLEKFLATSDAIVMERHGAVTLGRDLMSAYFNMERLEHAAQTVYMARTLGSVRSLPSSEVDRLMKIRENLGFASPAPRCHVCGAPHEPEPPRR
jgi:L-fuculose-phosphate aldolase